MISTRNAQFVESSMKIWIMNRIFSRWNIFPYNLVWDIVSNFSWTTVKFKMNKKKNLELCQKTYFQVMPWKTWLDCIKLRWWFRSGSFFDFLAKKRNSCEKWSNNWITRTAVRMRCAIFFLSLSHSSHDHDHITLYFNSI